MFRPKQAYLRLAILDPEKFDNHHFWHLVYDSKSKDKFIKLRNKLELNENNFRPEIRGEHTASPTKFFKFDILLSEIKLSKLENDLLNAIEQSKIEVLYPTTTKHGL